MSWVMLIIVIAAVLITIYLVFFVDIHNEKYKGYYKNHYIDRTNDDLNRRKHR